jgi:spore coat protein CotF
VILKVKPEKRQQLIDIREAFNLWDILSSKYLALERLHIWKNIAHDLDLNIIIDASIKTIKDNISILEKKMEQYSIKAPDRNRSFGKFPDNSKMVTDEFIALEIFLYYQEHIENLTKVLRSTVTNDSLRSAFKKMTIKTINETDILVTYLKLKGWIGTPPLYKQIPENVEAKLGVAEASDLWDHLTLRYDNIRTTELFLTITHDLDFKAVLGIGLKKLKEQSLMLEKELEHYGIPLPKKPPKTTLTLSNNEVMDDDYMYRILVNALQGAEMIHTKSFKECVICDRTRGTLKKLLLDEIELIDNLLKYGKMKGWLNPVPTYGP